MFHYWVVKFSLQSTVFLIQIQLPSFLSLSLWMWQQLISVPFYVLDQSCHANIFFCCQADTGARAPLPIQYQAQNITGSHIHQKYNQFQDPHLHNFPLLSPITWVQWHRVNPSQLHPSSEDELLNLVLTCTGMNGRKRCWRFFHRGRWSRKKVDIKTQQKLWPEQYVPALWQVYIASEEPCSNQIDQATREGIGGTWDQS